MERLTKRNEDGSVGISEFRYYNYRDFQKLASKLAEYEDLEEQGLLLRLPCKVGDTVYRIDIDEKIQKQEIEVHTIHNIVIHEDGDILFKYDVYDGIICHLKNIITDELYLDFYKIFLTKEEAEQALEKMKKEV